MRRPGGSCSALMARHSLLLTPPRLPSPGPCIQFMGVCSCPPAMITEVCCACRYVLFFPQLAVPSNVVCLSTLSTEPCCSLAQTPPNEWLCLPLRGRAGSLSAVCARRAACCCTPRGGQPQRRACSLAQPCNMGGLAGEDSTFT